MFFSIVELVRKSPKSSILLENFSAFRFERRRYIYFCTASYLMTKQDLSFISLEMFLATGLICGLLIPLPFPRFILVGYAGLLGFIEWFLFYSGYLRQRLRAKLPAMSIAFYGMISFVIFLPAIVICLIVFNRRL